MITTNYKTWLESKDLPLDVRSAIAEGAFVPLLDPAEAAELRRTVLEVFAECLEIYLEDHELRWRCDHLHRARPNLPMEAVFHAISVELGVSVARLRANWYASRRKAKVKAIVTQKINEKEQPCLTNAARARRSDS